MNYGLTCPFLETSVMINAWLVANAFIWRIYLPTLNLLLEGSSTWLGTPQFLDSSVSLSLFQRIGPCGISTLKDNCHQTYSYWSLKLNSFLVLSSTHENVDLKVMRDHMSKNQTSSPPIVLQFFVDDTRTQHYCSPYLLLG